jgi:hypothetical protein
VKGNCMPESKPGEACTVDLQCQGPESWCEGADGKGKAGKCALLPDKGKACAAIVGQEGSEDLCRQPYVCNPKSKLCIEAPGAGQPCIAGYCNFDLWCDADEKCKPWGKKGDACETYDDQSDTCDDGFLCSPADKCLELVCK